VSQKHRIPRNIGFYKQFTPEWYKGDFDAGNQRYFPLKVTKLVQKRELRKEVGHLTIILTLAGFYDHESRFCKHAIDYLLMNSDVLMQRFPNAKPTSSRHTQRERSEQHREHAIVSQHAENLSDQPSRVLVPSQTASAVAHQHPSPAAQQSLPPLPPVRSLIPSSVTVSTGTVPLPTTPSAPPVTSEVQGGLEDLMNYTSSGGEA